MIKNALSFLCHVFKGEKFYGLPKFVVDIDILHQLILRASVNLCISTIAICALKSRHTAGAQYLPKAKSL